MTMQNIVAGFHSTGVYHCDCTALRQVKPPSLDPKLGEKMGLKFIPLHSPFHLPCQQTPRSPRFTDEMIRFQQRFEEGYDLVHDEAYISGYNYTILVISHPLLAHLTMRLLQLIFILSSLLMIHLMMNLHLSTTTEPYQRHTSPSSDKSDVLSDSNVLSKFLTNAAPEICMPVARPKTSARVLTSLENVKIMEETEKRSC